MLVGCGEGTKPEPLRRVGSVAPAAKVEGEKPAPPGAPTLYQRLGEEVGLQKAATLALADPTAADLKSKVTPQQLGTLLVEASSGERPSNVPNLSATEWESLKQAVRGALLRLGVSGADRDEIIERMSKSKR
jgi:hypothetical protein